MSPRRARNRSKDFIPRGLDLFGEGIGLVRWNPWLDVTPTFCKNNFFVQIGVHIKMHIKL
jgi:hypothetical protein